MGKVIGKNRERLKHITEKNTGVEFKTDPKSNQDGALYIRGPLESQKRAIRKIKEIVVSSGLHGFSFEIMFLISRKRRGPLYGRAEIRT